MRWTTRLLAQAAAAKVGRNKALSLRATATTTKKQRDVKALALSVYFKQPELGVHEPEILCRGTAFLLGVDPPELEEPGEGPYGHLELSRKRREDRDFKRAKPFTPAGVGDGDRDRKKEQQKQQRQRRMMDMGWLEFVPREYRPQVHLVCCSHVVAPFSWRDYYPHDWLTKVRREHCTYAVEVIDPERQESPGEALATLPLGEDVDPYHHPEGRDLALLHFREEASALKVLKGLGVDVLRLRDPDDLYERGEDVSFHGFLVDERDAAEGDEYQQEQQQQQQQQQQEGVEESSSPKSSSSGEDDRIFYPRTDAGKLAFHTDDRFFATTPEPLQQGMCGAPVLDDSGALCGMVEGVVPAHHENKKLAGCAAFITSYQMQGFVDYVERGMVKRMMPPDLFETVVRSKETNSVGGGVFKRDEQGKYTVDSTWDEAYDTTIEALKRKLPPHRVEAILDAVREDRKEILETFDREGGNMDDIIMRVQAKRRQIQGLVHDQYRRTTTTTRKQQQQQQQQREDSNIIEAETTTTTPRDNKENK